MSRRRIARLAARAATYAGAGAALFATGAVLGVCWHADWWRRRLTT